MKEKILKLYHYDITTDESSWPKKVHPKCYTAIKKDRVEQGETLPSFTVEIIEDEQELPSPVYEMHKTNPSHNEELCRICGLVIEEEKTEHWKNARKIEPHREEIKEVLGWDINEDPPHYPKKMHAACRYKIMEKKMPLVVATPNDFDDFRFNQRKSPPSKRRRVETDISPPKPVNKRPKDSKTERKYWKK